MHRHTPSITVIEPRVLPVRELAYHRRATGDLLETRVTHQAYDTAGRLCEQRDPRLFVSSLTDPEVPVNLRTIYSLSGQSLCSDSVDAGWQLSLPGPDGLAVKMWDQRGWHRRIEYDLLLRPVAIAEHISGEPECYAERITWGRYTPIDAMHNRSGQPVRHDDPAGSRLISEYGLSGAVLEEVRHFLASLEAPDWPDAEAECDLLLEPGEGARCNWRFAATGEVLSQMDAKGHTRHLRHDCIGQLREIGLQRAQCNTVETLVGGIEYSAAGQVLEELAGNGIRTVSSYDLANGHLLTLANQAPNGQFLQKLSYCYDPAGNIINITDAALPIQYSANQRIEPVRHFTYDTLYQLIKATGWESAKPSLGPALPEWQAFGSADSSRWCNYTETYFYDAAGNLLQRVHQGAVDDTLTMQVAAHSNRSIKDRPGAELDGLFDARGNLLELQPGQSLQWNGRNELSEVVQVARRNAPSDREFYGYDHEGMRVRKCRTAAAKSIIHTADVRYLPGLELHSNSATGENLQVVSVQAGRCSVRLLHWSSSPPDGVINDQLRYCFDDHLGSSAIEVDADAKPISQEIYYPFGGTACLVGRNKVETSYKTIRYSGKERDAAGLYYYGARYYAPWLQRWLNPDPAGNVDGLNLYRFVRNAPPNYRDETGLAPTPASDCKQLPLYLHQALMGAKDIVERALIELDAGRGARFLETHIGTASPEDFDYLTSGFKYILWDIEHIEKNPHRLVSVSGSRDIAYVLKTNPDREIYINRAQFNALSPENRSDTLIHELTHLSFIFDSYDFWYVSTINGRSPDELAFISASIISTGVINPTLLGRHMKVLTNLAREATVNGALAKFNSSRSFRAYIASRNADTLTNVAVALSRNNKGHNV
ncbi:RHS repeat domain-containing protein [Pseudomonas sp. TMB3-21]